MPTEVDDNEFHLYEIEPNDATLVVVSSYRLNLPFCWVEFNKNLKKQIHITNERKIASDADCYSNSWI